jgi:hypothetical protein
MFNAERPLRGLVLVQWTTSNDLEYESGGEPWAGEEDISDTVLSSNGKR